MATEQATKSCTKCGAKKSLAEFYRSSRASDGRCPQCIACMKAYAKTYCQTPEAKALRLAACKRHRMTDEFRAKRNERQRAKYNADAVYRAKIMEKCARFAKTEAGKRMQRKAMAKYKQRHPERVAARSAVNHAIESGKLPEPDTLLCKCGAPAAEYHHHNGYSKEHWLDVVPLCCPCHDLLIRKHFPGLDPAQHHAE